MQLKTFKASTLARALERARRESGPDAVVLATNEVEGQLGLTSVEITVAVERQPVNRQSDPEVERLSREVRELRSTLEHRAPTTARRLASATSRLVRRVVESTPVTGKPAIPSTRKPPRQQDSTGRADATLRAAIDALIRAGLSPDLAARFARNASIGVGPGIDRSRLAEAAENAMRELIPFASSDTKPELIFVVGPPGAGKTTTMAKLASRFSSDGRKVIYANADQERPGAAEQSEALAGQLGLELRAIHDVRDLLSARRLAGGNGTVIVDTAGIGAADHRRLTRLERLCRSSLEAEVLLVLPAGLHAEEAQRLIRRFRALSPTSVALSRVDDGERIGELVNALADSHLPLAFLTTGHRVPADIEEASPRRLAALLLRSGFRAHSRQETHS